MSRVFWYIHGANASPTSFNYLKSCFPTHEFEDIAYSCERSVATVVEGLTTKAALESREITIVGHSLGGVIAVAVSHKAPNIRKIATMASPFGGSNIASFMRWVVPCALFEDVCPSSPLIRHVQSRAPQANVLSIVSTGGHSPLISGPNDGVVTVSSQMALTGPTYVKLDKNHFEVLIHPQIANTLKAFLF